MSLSYRVFNFSVRNDINLSPLSDTKDEYNHVVRITMSKIHTDMQNVAFYFRKRAGFPRVSASGLADVQIGGRGITVKVTVVSTMKDRQAGDHLFVVKKVSVKIDTLKFMIHDVRF